MESLPDLPATPDLRAFVIWASAGLLGISVGLIAAGLRRDWKQLARAASPIGVMAIGMAAGLIVPGAHIWAMWAAVVLCIWAAHKNSGLSSFAVFLGGLGLAAASFLARSLF